MKLPEVLHRSLGPVAEGFSPPDCVEQRARIHPVAPGRASTTGFIPMKSSTSSEPRMAAMGFCTAPQGTSLPSTRTEPQAPGCAPMAWGSGGEVRKGVPSRRAACPREGPSSLQHKWGQCGRKRTLEEEKVLGPLWRNTSHPVTPAFLGNTGQVIYTEIFTGGY